MNHSSIKNRKWNKRLITIIIFVAVSLMSMNYLVDPYQVFHSNVLTPSSTSNERFNKIEYLLKNKHKYNAFLLGSSRMGVFDPSWFNRVGVKFYNLSVFSGDAKDMLQMLKFLNNEGVLLKEVVLGVDMFPFIEKYRNRPASLQHHPRVSGKSKLKFYVQHLFSSSLYQSYLKLDQHFGEQLFVFNSTTGQWSLPALERLIQADAAGYQQRFFKDTSLPPMKVVWQSIRIKEFRELMNWLRSHNIIVRSFIHPFSQSHQRRFTSSNIKDFRQLIKRINPEVWDFSGKSDWTGNLNNYYEKKHYRKILAKRIAIQLN